MTAPLDLAERAAATGRVVTRFRDRPFSWRDRATCLHLVRAQMRALGHRPPRIPDFRSPIGARRALQARGQDSVQALLDSLLPRIAPAAMIVGDIALLPGEPPFEAAVIAAGGQKVFGWHGEDLSRLVPIEIGRGDLISAYAVGR